MLRIFRFKKIILSLFILLGVLSIFSLTTLKFSFDFNQFFPEGDEDLEFYNEFISEFGVDDSFLLIAVESEQSVFNTDFLNRFKALSEASKEISFVTDQQSLVSLEYPVKTSLGFASIPVIHIADSSKYDADWLKIQKDQLFINSLIDKNARSMVLVLETEDSLDYTQSIELLTQLRMVLKTNGFNRYHLLGRTYFYEALIEMQKQELIKTSVISLILVLIILFLVYRRPVVIAIVMSSIVLALLLFLGLLALLGKELNSLASFYPILILIVGTSDVIHIMDDYFAKLREGLENQQAMIHTLKEVGVSTLLTSITTAIGFASLLSSKSSVVSGFGIDSAMGVLIAFMTIIGFSCTLLLLVPKEKMLVFNNPIEIWQQLLSKLNVFTQAFPRSILVASFVFLLICLFGVLKINTNYQIRASLPQNSQLTTDFDFFQNNYGGFRPLEVAVSTKNEFKITDYQVVLEIEKVVQRLKSLGPIKNVQSVNLFYKGINKANHLNKSEFFVLPDTETDFNDAKKAVMKFARKPFRKFVNAEENKSRISAKVLDVGLDTLQKVYQKFNTFVATETDSNKVKFRLTGTGILLDKNAFYVKESLLQGLLMGLLLVAIIMALLYKNVKLLLISLIPNMLPLLFAAALVGYFGIPLEATISVVFAIVFGIAVDDTIHFLGRYKIGLSKGLNKEDALKVTFEETGRALIITTLILFFGFLVLLFSVHLPSITIGLLISVTLLAALILDLILLPVLIRKLL